MNKLSGFILTFFLTAGLLQAKSNTTKGTEFWLGYMDNISLNMNFLPKFSIILSSEYQANVRITIKNNSFNEIFISLVPNEAKEVFLPVNEKAQKIEDKVIYYPISSELVENLGIHILSDKPVSVYSMHYRAHFSEASIVLPVEELGKEYNVIAGRDYKYPFLHPSEFLIVGADDGTEIEITPSAMTRNGRPAGIPFGITLHKGEVYQVKSTYNYPEYYDNDNPKIDGEPDLTGTIIKGVNDKNFSVYSGAKQAATLPNFPDNHLWDQNYPLESWGTDYFYIPFKNQKGDVVKILAAENSTIIYLDCEKDTILNKGGYCTRLLSEPVYISSNKKICVAQLQKPSYITGYKYGDPSMLILPPINFQARKVSYKIPYYSDSLPLVKFFEYYTNIITKTDDAVNLKLNGKTIESQFQPISSAPAYSFAQVELTGENQTIESGGGFYAYTYGYGVADSYTYHLGYDYHEDFFRGKVILPDTTASLTEFNIKIPVYFNLQSSSMSKKINDLTIKLHFDNRSFYFKGLTRGKYAITTEDTTTYLAIELEDIEIKDSLEILTYIIGDPLFSEAKYTDLIIDEIMTSDALMMVCRKNMMKNGSLTGFGCTPIYFSLQKILANNLALLENPVTDELNAEIETYEQGPVQCTIYDFTGRQLFSDSWTAPAGAGLWQKHNFRFNLNIYANGIYLVVIKTPLDVISKPFVKISR